MPGKSTAPMQRAQPTLNNADVSTDDSSAEELKRIEPEKIRIAIFCALTDEAVAIRCCLDEEFACHPKSRQPTNYVYTYGRMGVHKLVIAQPHQMGTVQAAHCATTVSQHFPNVKFALMVGIGAGIPNVGAGIAKSSERDIRLGDIAVSNPQNGHPGVIQYDFSKNKMDEHVLKGCLNKPPGILISADELLKQDEMMNKSPLMKILETLIEKSGFVRPQNSDILFEPDFPHVKEGNDCTECEACTEKKIMRRPQRHKQVVVHRGLILSGNTVLKNPHVRDELRQRFSDPICLEMEAAGIMDEIPCLVVRGICDYADTHKNDEWHQHAAAVAAAYCKALLRRVGRQELAEMTSMSQVLNTLSDVKESQKIITRTVNAIKQNNNLEKLPYAEGAIYGSYADQHEVECLDGTRTELLHGIESWAKNPAGKCIFWLRGKAGTGKSTVSRTVVRLLDGLGSLGASFFFKRGGGSRGNAVRLFSTIVRQLVHRIPPLAAGLEAAIENDREISEKSLDEQFDKLLLQPLLGLKEKNSITMVIVIDALDECELDEDMRMIIRLLPQVQVLKSVRLRFFVTSRPELPIRMGFDKIDAPYDHLVLDEIPMSVTEHDIWKFLKHRLSQLRQVRPEKLPLDWPGDDIIQTLVRMSVPLFIFAATICRVFEDLKWDPDESLKLFLTHQNEASRLHRTYLPVFDGLLIDQEHGSMRDRLIDEYRAVIGTIITLRSPLSVSSLANLMDVAESAIRLRLNYLHSILSVPDDVSMPVKLLHLSLRDFLTHKNTREKTPFWVDEKAVHHNILVRCLAIMNRLKENICDMPFEGAHRANIDPIVIEQCLSSDLKYACRYWAAHLIESPDPAAELNNSLRFLQEHALHWMEAMILMGDVLEIAGTIDSLLSIKQIDKSSTIAQFLTDMKRFCLKNRQIIDIAPLQLYCAGLIFAPQKSLIRQTYLRELPVWLRKPPNVEEFWNAEIQTFEGHSSPVMSLGFSLDGRIMASGGGDRTVKIWDTNTGALRQTFRDHARYITVVVSSPDGELLASGSRDKTVKVYNIITGDLQHTLEGHSNDIRTVAFSPNSQLVATGSNDKTIKLWNVTTGVLQHTLKSHTAPIESVVFSLDNQLLAAGSEDSTVTLWDVTTGELQQTFEGDLTNVKSLSFTPDSQLLAVGLEIDTVELWDVARGLLRQKFRCSIGAETVTLSPDNRLIAISYDDRTAQLYDVESGVLQQTLEGHAKLICALAISKDGQLVATGCEDGILKLWNVNRGDHQNSVGTQSPVRLVKISPDGQLTASSCGKTIKLWDTTTGDLLKTFDGHLDSVRSVDFSPDSRIIAFGTGDGSLKLWDITTGSLSQNLMNDSAAINLVVFSPDGHFVAASAEDNIIRLWDTTSKAEALWQTFEDHTSYIHTVVFSPDGQRIATGSSDRTMKLWHINTGTPQQTFEGHSDPVISVTFSHDSRFVATGSYDRTVKIWNIAAGAKTQLLSLEDHSDSILSVAFSLDGGTLASSSRDKTIRLWDATTGTPRQTLPVQLPPTEMTFSKHGSYLETNIGTLPLGAYHQCEASGTSQKGVEVIIDGHWVAVRGQKVLWLPPEYQALCSASVNGTLVIGNASGRVFFMDFR